MSLNEPAIVRLDPAVTATIRDVVTIDELPAFFDRAFSTLGELIRTQRISITGPAFSLGRACASGCPSGRCTSRSHRPT